MEIDFYVKSAKVGDWAPILEGQQFIVEQDGATFVIKALSHSSTDKDRGNRSKFTFTTVCTLRGTLPVFKGNSWTIMGDTWYAQLKSYADVFPVAEYVRSVHEDAVAKFNDYSPKEDKPMKLTAMAKLLLDADTRTLRNAGYLDENLALTCAGMAALDAIIFAANKPALVAAAQAEIDERKAEANK